MDARSEIVGVLVRCAIRAFVVAGGREGEERVVVEGRGTVEEVVVAGMGCQIGG